MSTDFRNLKILMEEIDANDSIKKIIQQQQSEHTFHGFDTRNHYTKEGQDNRLNFLQNHKNVDLPVMSNNAGIDDISVLKGNIENFIGFSKIPTGLAGPLLVNGTEANGQLT